MAEARLAALGLEAASDGLPERRLAAIATEVITDSVGIPSKRLSAISLETITDSAGPNGRRLSALSIEVLTPAQFVFVGWGLPL